MASKGSAGKKAFWTSRYEIDLPVRASSILELAMECESSHPLCRPKLPAHFYGPARLLDVGSAENPSPDIYRLVQGEPVLAANNRYIALSYCWGGDVPLRTTQDKLAAFTVSIAFDSFPKTFQDTILMTRALGLRYLWIDALCIVQDDRREWKQEASKISYIFQRAYLTISATSAKNSNEKLDVSNIYPPTLQVDLPSEATSANQTPDGPESIATNQRIHIDLLPHPQLEVYLKESPQNRRGWTFQETVLSRRIVHLTTHQFFWQCHTFLESEDGSYYTADHDRGFVNSRPLVNMLKLQKAQWPSEVWWRWMFEFWKRRFTYASDDLPALAGVTRLYQDSTGDMPVVGMWKSSLALDMAWYLPRPVPDEQRDYKMLSWSWTSIRHSSRTRISISHIPFSGIVDDDGHSVFWTAEIGEVDIEWEEHPLIPPLRRACISIFGIVWSEQLSKFTEALEHSEVFFDTDLKRSPSEHICFILLFAGRVGLHASSDLPESPPSYYYLMIEPVSSQAFECYRRIGIAKRYSFELKIPESLEGRNPTMIRLV